MPAAPSKPTVPQGPARWVFRAAWGYFASVVALWLVMVFASEHWWPATLLLFAPRWPWALPLVLLLPIGLRVGRRVLLPTLLAALLVFGPFWGLCVPLAPLVEGQPEGIRLRVLSCNTAGRSLNVEALREVLRTAQPDVVALQEWFAEFEPEVFADPGWHVHSGPRLCLASRFPIERTGQSPDENNWRDLLLCCALNSPSGRISCCNLHLPTARSGLEALRHFDANAGEEMALTTELRRRESQRAVQFALKFDGPLLIAGDFNMPVESTLYQQDWGRFSNAFSRAGFGWGGTKFTRWHSVRIDHILGSPEWRFTRSWIGPDVGSDHRPILADVSWVGTGAAVP